MSSNNDKHVGLRVANVVGPLSYSYGLYRYGPYSYGPYSYDLYSYGPYSYGLYTYGLYDYGLYLAEVVGPELVLR